MLGSELPAHVTGPRLTVTALLRDAPAFCVFSVLAALAALTGGLVSLLTQDPPVRDPRRLAWVSTTQSHLTSPALRRALSLSAEIEDVALFTTRTATVIAGRTSYGLLVGEASPNLFAMLGVQLAQGAAPPADSRGEHLLLSDGAARRLGLTMSQLGNPVSVDGMPVTVTGVLPRGFSLAGVMPDVWLYAHDAPGVERYGHTLVRVAEGVSQQQLDEVSARSGLAPFVEGEPRLELLSVHARRKLVHVTRPLGISALALGAMATVLLALIMSKRALDQRSATAQRVALGARPHHILRLSAAYYCMTFACALSLTWFIAPAVLTLILAVSADSMSLFREADIVGPALKNAAICSVVAVGAALASEVVINSDILARPSRALNGRSESSGRRWLLAGDGFLALAALLATAIWIPSGVLLATAREALSEDLGLSNEDLHLARVTLPPGRYDSPESQRGVYQALFPPLGSEGPERDDAALANNIPLSGRDRLVSIRPQGQPPTAGPELKMVSVRVVDGSYFTTLGVRVLSGRPFDGRDHQGAELVALLSEPAALTVFGTTAAVGRTIVIGGFEYRVIGLTRATKGALKGLPLAEVILPFPQLRAEHRFDDVMSSAWLGTSAGPGQLARMIAQLRRIEPDVLVSEQATLLQLRRRRGGGAFVAAHVAALVAGTASVGVMGVMCLLTLSTIRVRRRDLMIAAAVGGRLRHLARYIVQRLTLIAVGCGIVGCALGAVATAVVLPEYSMGSRLLLSCVLAAVSVVTGVAAAVTVSVVQVLVRYRAWLASCAR